MANSTDFISPESCFSLPDLFLERVSRSPDSVAYRHFNSSRKGWLDLTWQEMLALAKQWRNGLKNENLSVGDRVAIMLPNCPEWILFEQAALSLGLIVVPLYANDRPESIAYILKDTESRIVILPGNAYWGRLAPALAGITSLQRIITIDLCWTDGENNSLVCLDDWLPPADNSPGGYTPTTHETATIVYTSGTTGPPKGVMLSHMNILDNCYFGLQRMAVYPEDRFLSFLPLSHMLERTAGYYLPMMAGSTVAFARSIPDLGEDMLTEQPTVLVAVPRIFERIHSEIKRKLTAKPAIAVALFKKAVSVGWNQFEYTQGRAPWSVSFLILPFLDRLIGTKIRDKFGGHLRIIITGGAPLSGEISKLFLGLGLPLYQGYGLTETSPVISVNTREDNDPNGVGTPLQGIEVRSGPGDELLVRGHCVMQGYWKNQQATEETIDPDGWLHTGDRATIQQNGHIRITGRLKEILVLSNGEKVAPADMEMAIAMDPLFEHTMIIGEARPFLTLVSVLNEHLWKQLAEDLSVPDDESSLMLTEVEEAVLKRVEVQLTHFPGYAFVKHAILSLSPWTVENGLLTPTLKLKRKIIEKRLKEQIEKTYDLNTAL